MVKVKNDGNQIHASNFLHDKNHIKQFLKSLPVSTKKPIFSLSLGDLTMQSISRPSPALSAHIVKSFLAPRH